MKDLSKTRVILDAVFDEAPRAAACQDCQASLAAYVDAELDGQPAAVVWPAVTGHLATCAECRREYVELRDVLAMERLGQVEKPSASGVFDFGYLQIGPFSEERSNRLFENAATRRAWRLEALGRLVIQFSADLLAALQPLALQSAYLKGVTTPALSYAVDGQIDDLNVRVYVEPSRRVADTVSVEVEVDITSRGGWPNLAGSTVTLRRGLDEVIDEQETDSFGKAVFERVPVEDLTHLRVEIAIT